MLLASTLLAGFRAEGVEGQLSSPCDIECGVVLGATGFTVAMGAAVAAGRASGGISNMTQAAGIWGGSLLLFLGGGIALGENGERQERAVYASGIGALAGSLAGLGVEATLGGGDRARSVAAALIGAAAGAVVGGVYGALSYEGDDTGAQLDLLQVSIAF